MRIRDDYSKGLSACLGSDDWKLTQIEQSETDKVSGPYRFQLSHQKHTVSYFYLVPMPGCCGIIISTGAYIYADYRCKGLGTLLNKIRIDFAKELGYGLLLCTDIESNKTQRQILQKNNWQDLCTFTNPRTHNTVIISAIEL